MHLHRGGERGRGPYRGKPLIILHNKVSKFYSLSGEKKGSTCKTPNSFLTRNAKRLPGGGGLHPSSIGGAGKNLVEGGDSRGKAFQRRRMGGLWKQRGGPLLGLYKYEGSWELLYERRGKGVSPSSPQLLGR